MRKLPFLNLGKSFRSATYLPLLLGVSRRRWLFNFAHWFLGNATLLLALTCIFLAPRFPDVTAIVDEFEFLLVATLFVAVLGIAHLVLTALNYRVDGHNRTRFGIFVEPLRYVSAYEHSFSGYRTCRAF